MIFHMVYLYNKVIIMPVSIYWRLCSVSMISWALISLIGICALIARRINRTLPAGQGVLFSFNMHITLDNFIFI